MQNQVQKAQGSIKDMAKSIGKTEVPTGFNLREVADTTGSTHKMIDVDKTTIKDLAQKITAKGEGSKGTVKNNNSPKNSSIIKEVRETDFGEHIIKGKNGKKELLPNIKYITKDNYKYTTDELGRIVNVVASTLVLKKADRNKYAQANIGGKDRLPDDDGGHLIGAQFNGPPDIDNLVPQNSQINRRGGVWYEMET